MKKFILFLCIIFVMSFSLLAFTSCRGNVQDDGPGVSDPY